MAQFTVNNINDSGIGSLRQAIEDANNLAGADAIVFASTLSGSTIILTDPDGDGYSALQITDSLTISGLGADLLAVSGNNIDRVFDINNGDDDVQIVVSIDGLTITNGFAYDGGGIANQENTTITNSIITQNTSKTEEDNEGDIGGGILNDKGILAISNSTISNNLASTGSGIYNLSGQIFLINSTVSGNRANLNGGGIYNVGTATITNSTISGNSAASGGGLYNYTSELDALTLTNTIIANSTGGDFVNVGSGTFSSIGNLVGDGSDPNALFGEPLLGLLQNNGGTTPTHALLEGSAAINAGSNANISPGLTTDQRGQTRIVSGTVDIGAYEATVTTPLPQLSINSVTVIDDASILSNAVFTVTLSSASSTSVAVGYNTQDGSAIALVDYTPVGGTLTLAPGQTTATIAVPIIGDTIVEPDESFFLILSNASNATIAVPQGGASIITLAPAQYGASYPDLIAGYGYDLPALTAHYLNFGAGVRTPDLFDENHYVASNTDLIPAPSIVEPTTRLVNADGAAEHYIRSGFGEGRSLTSFQRDQYIASYSDLIASYGYDLTGGSIHYVGYGFNEGRAADSFDEYRYLAGYDDLLNGYGTDAVGATQQYILAGSQFSAGAEGRDPLAFKSDIYIASYSDLIEGVKTIADYSDKLEYSGFHYVTAGRGEGRAREVFDPIAYQAKYSDLAAYRTLEELTRHYIEHGYDEGRRV